MIHRLQPKIIRSLILATFLCFLSKGLANNPTGIVVDAEAAFMQGNYGLAIHNFSEAIKDDPKHAGYYAARGWAYEKNGQYQMALADLDRAVFLMSTNSEYFLLRGSVYLDMTNLDKATENYNKVIQLNPSSFSAYSARAMANYFKGDFDASIIDCDKALLIKSNLPDVYCLRANAYRGKVNSIWRCRITIGPFVRSN